MDPDSITPHVMRHTAVTRLVRAKTDIPTILKISGHKTVAMVLRYAHVDGEHIDIAAATLGMDFAGPIHQEFTTKTGEAGEICNRGRSLCVGSSQIGLGVIHTAGDPFWLRPG